MLKVMAIVREEMNAIGGQEFHFPALNPTELWEQTGRVQAFGDSLFHVKNRPLILAPTHEEVVAWIAKNHVASYKDLPQIWYQIQTKFRNEPRPRSGVLRGRQFIMKDSYTLDATREGLDHGYDLHAEAYRKIFARCGLKFFVVGASSGAMGGSASQEFMVESEAGEDTVALSEDGSYAANLEVATSLVPNARRFDVSQPIAEIHTPNVRTIDQVAAFLGVETERCAKSVVYWGGDQPLLVLMMGNDGLNESKLLSVIGAAVRPMEADRLMELTGADAGSIGPVGLQGFRILADKRLEGANELISGANKNDFHLMHIDLLRDCAIERYVDLRTIQPGEQSPQGTGVLKIVNGVELGHIFKLGTKYSESLNAKFLDENGKENPIIMGSYGIGIERIVACHIEQSHDDDGIIWDKAIAPFQVHLIAVGTKSAQVLEMSERLYDLLTDDGIEVLYDDRKDISPGFKFKDADLLGMPYQVIVGERNLRQGKIEIKERRTGERIFVDVESVLEKVQQLLA
jgi:prolyl-tRNA synthetase